MIGAPVREVVRRFRGARNWRGAWPVDLPGIYSLTADSNEQRIARDFILQEHVVMAANAPSMIGGVLYDHEIIKTGLSGNSLTSGQIAEQPE